METQTQIDKWGNSLALRIPQHISDRLGLNTSRLTSYLSLQGGSQINIVPIPA